MQIKQLLDDDQAVSPVIGVILMVAITVILAAVIGTFVLGLGDQVQNQAPQITWEFSTSPTDDNTQDCQLTTGGIDISITHGGGDSVSSDNLQLSSSGGTISDVTSTCYGGTTTTLTAGSSLEVETTSGNTVRIVYANPNSDKTNVIGSFEVP